MSPHAASRDQMVSLLKPYGRRIAIIGLVLVAGALLELVPPLVMQRVIDEHLTIARAEGLIQLALVYLGAVALIQVIGFLGSYLTALTAQAALRDLRIRLFDHFQKLPLSYYDRIPWAIRFRVVRQMWIRSILFSHRAFPCWSQT